MSFRHLIFQGIDYVFVWHALSGYWGGVSENVKDDLNSALNMVEEHNESIIMNSKRLLPDHSMKTYNSKQPMMQNSLTLLEKHEVVMFSLLMISYQQF